MKYTISNNRTRKTGRMVLVKIKDVKVGDMISSQRRDKNSHLEVFFKVTFLGAWGVHDYVIMGEEPYVIVPYAGNIEAKIRKVI